MLFYKIDFLIELLKYFEQLWDFTFIAFCPT